MVGTEQVVPAPGSLFDGRTSAMPPLGATLDAREIGCLVLGPAAIPWWARLGLARPVFHDAIAACRRPVLVPRGNLVACKRMLVCLEDGAQREVAIAAIDLARQIGATLDALTVRTVGDDVDRVLEAVPHEVELLARLHALEIPHHFATGNPVRRIREIARGYDLVVVGLHRSRSSVFSPDVSVFLVHHMPVSTLFVPWTRAAA
jgi:nucleotide-binding universal stress UspA family protein